MTAGLILSSTRNQWNNIFQTLILFSTSTDQAIYGILVHLGISTAYSTTVQQLHAMADSSKEFLKNLGLSTFDTASHTLRVRTGFPFRSDCQSEADLGSAYRLAPQSPGP